MAAKGIVNPITAVIAVVTFIATAWLQVSPVSQVGLAAAAGLILRCVDGTLGSRGAEAESGSKGDGIEGAGGEAGGKGGSEE
jgi:uncharacterized membrane protein YgcG